MEILRDIAAVGAVGFGIFILVYSCILVWVFMRNNGKSNAEPNRWEYRVLELENYIDYKAEIEKGSEDDWQITSAGPNRETSSWFVVYGRPIRFNKNDS